MLHRSSPTTTCTFTDPNPRGGSTITSLMSSATSVGRVTNDHEPGSVDSCLAFQRHSGAVNVQVSAMPVTL